MLVLRMREPPQKKPLLHCYLFPKLLCIYEDDLLFIESGGPRLSERQRHRVN